ncbi:triphosphoribosyl-dephospho-CoA synthase CitG [Vibrio mangrovi]|uniref:Probable 2-(5''-triphosphoribosyl)-3'-dephosphocoenzyme-A synthase n=1 Tax=Vibrio mangrovi TaxID=474394 RepID=A0A1Y6INR1_9VIBR|nr:triphosphoribosyl-dephospho-CoA synthase CitG [Vibrio mangrovi]MDW6003901.1 triphosphoribosyl-dephospho-CoA synthase CitG [Vibrio mangrovi]SMR99305.1 2-(5''-triphosphoribosyl)-3'-dephosphocoenzyme-A synthase [Vibrio mangrovi]
MQTSAVIDLLFDEQQWLLNSENIGALHCHIDGQFPLDQLVGNLAYHAMMLEVHLTPKPGLVDTVNQGAHQDMDLDLFVQSANALAPYMARFVRAGWQHHNLPVASLLSMLRPVGIEAEAAMFEATSGVNTHKGMIFSMGLICGVVGWLKANRLNVDSLYISKAVSQCCQHLVWNELRDLCHRLPVTQGEKLYQQYGVTGARGEAASGFSTVMVYALPAYQSCIEQGFSTEQALWQTLLVLVANNQDTNLLSRGGMAGLQYAQEYALSILAAGGVSAPDIEAALSQFDRCLIERNLSPGGSADLLAVTWLIAELEQIFPRKD